MVELEYIWMLIPNDDVRNNLTINLVKVMCAHCLF